MADQIDPAFVDGLRELLGSGKVRFITATDANPAYGEALVKLMEKEVDRINASAEEVRRILQAHEEAGRPYGLYLRSFELEGYQYDKASTETDPEQRTFFTVNGPSEVEKHLHQRLQAQIPFVAIRNQSSWLMNALIPRFTARDTDWEVWVADLAKKASLIVLECFALSPGVLTELTILADSGRQDATVIVLSEDNDRVRAELSAFEGLALTSFERPDRNHPVLAAFSRICHEREIDWARIETSPPFADLLAVAHRLTAGDFSPLPPPHRLRLLGQRVRELRKQGELADAAAVAAEAISVATAFGDPEQLAGAQLAAGIVEYQRDRLEEALPLLQGAGLTFHRIGNKDAESAAAMWAGLVYKRGQNADKAVMMFLIALQSSYELGAHGDMAAVLREMAPLLDELSPERRQHPGVRRAARLIEQLGLGRANPSTPDASKLR